MSFIEKYYDLLCVQLLKAAFTSPVLASVFEFCSKLAKMVTTKTFGSVKIVLGVKNKNVSSKELLKIVKAVTNGIENVDISKKHQEEFKKYIPLLIKKGNIKISLKDVTDINKDRLKDIVLIGRELIDKKIEIGRAHV